MKYDHYITVQLTKNATFSNKQCANYLMREVHHFNSHSQNTEKVAFSFPEFALHGKLGEQFQIFGSFDALEKLYNQKDFAYLLAMKHCFVRAIRPIPEEIEQGYCAFHRDQRHQKQTPKYVARSEARAIRRAMEGKNTRLTCADDVLKRRADMLKKLNDTNNQCIDIQVHSASHESGFFLYVKAQKFESIQLNSPTNYGLSSATQPLTLPLFLDPLF